MGGEWNFIHSSPVFRTEYECTIFYKGSFLRRYSLTNMQQLRQLLPVTRRLIEHHYELRVTQHRAGLHRVQAPQLHDQEEQAEQS